MLKVGLTGGLATGKSFVGEALRDLGCHLIKADDLGREVMQVGGEAYEAIVREFGRQVLDENGAIDRRRLAAEVFDAPERLALLNSLVHPHVIRREEEQMRAIARLDPRGIAVVEAAILIETGSHRRFDKLILVVCGEQQQIERAMRRDGATREDVLARLSRQMPLAEKRAYADFIIDTSGDKETTLLRTREVYNQLRALQK